MVGKQLFAMDLDSVGVRELYQLHTERFTFKG